MDPTLDFQVRVETQRRTFVEEILPRYVERYLRGHGHELVVRMLEAHDRGELHPGGPPPSERARHLAQEAGETCPLTVHGHLEAQPGGVVLGRFNHDQGRIDLFEGSFHTLCGPDELDRQLMHTLFHEYVRFMETWLPLQDEAQPGLEPSPDYRSITAEHARVLDTRWELRRWALWGGVALVLVISLLIVAAQFV